MTGKVLSNVLFAAGGVAVASLVWAGAILLPSRDARVEAPGAASQPAPAVQPPVQSAAVDEPAPVQREPASAREDAAPAAAAAPQPAAPAAPLMAGMDRNAFGLLLPLTIAPAPGGRGTMLDSGAPLSLRSAPLQSIGDTFSEQAAQAALPELGGAAALDGPADAGLDQTVAQADIPESRVPPPTGRIIALDASEGTKLDPLRQRNWDLNAVQNVPVIPPAPKR